MKHVAIGFMAIFLSGTASAFDINSYCSQVSDAVGGSYQIEKACREQEHEAKTKVHSVSIPSRIEKYCREVGQAVGGSYQIMEACIRQEIQAKNSLQ